jgi:hypothetical protein
LAGTGANAPGTSNVSAPDSHKFIHSRCSDYCQQGAGKEGAGFSETGWFLQQPTEQFHGSLERSQYEPVAFKESDLGDSPLVWRYKLLQFEVLIVRT